MANPAKAAEYRRMFRDETITYALTAATDPDRAPLITCLNSKHTIYVQRIAVHVTTSAAQAITFRAQTTTTVIPAVLPASAAAGDQHVLIDLEEGYALPAGEHLEVSGTAGVAGLIQVQAYQRLTPGAAGITPADLG